MPKISGHDVFKKIKSFHSNLPIIMISGYRIEENLIKSMDDLIDDFIFKPVCSEELIARINNKIAKYENKQNLTSIEDLYDDILFNDFEEKVTIDGNEYDLKGKEYRLLKYMVTNKNQLISRDEIFSKVWNDTFVSSATLDTHLCQLRKKLDKHGDRLITRKNSGFIYSKELNQ
jgi:DNA-binding response OmpR family regulator